MIQVSILSGEKAGGVQVVRRFPFCIGRAAGSHLLLTDLGVWDNHLLLVLQKKEGFILQAAPGALATLNDAPLDAARLRNGDVVTLGAARLQFWLAAPRQRSLGLREWLVWLLLATVAALQFFLIYRVLK